MSHVFQCSVKLGPVKKVKLTQKSEKKLEHITVQKCSSTMSVSALYTIFVPLFPLSYSSNDCYLSFHYIFLPQAAKPEAEHYFPLFPHSTALQIFSLERSLQESVLDTLELSVSLPTSPCSTSWLGQACHSLLNHLCPPSLSQHRPQLSECSPAKPAAGTAKSHTAPGASLCSAAHMEHWQNLSWSLLG